MKCPKCNFENAPEMKFCGQCGTPLMRECPACGYANPPGHHFCGMCATSLLEEPGPTQPLQPQLSPAEPSPLPVQLEGERRIATVILADVKGSTALGGQMSTEAFVEILNHVFQILSAEIYRYGGEVDQYRGDCVVAFFGVKRAHEDDPERAVLAALAMQEAVRRYSAELVEREGIELQLRVGVNTGEVIAAHIGDRRRYSEDTAIGRAIALANRLQTAAEPGTVLVSENTQRLVGPLFEWEALGEIRLKGFRQPVPVYRPLAHKAGADKVRGIAGLASPLVGRQAEFRALGEAVERLRAGVGGIVTLVGEAGIGKSRLVAELRKREHRAGGKAPQWMEGRCLSYGANIAYQLWLDALRSVLGVSVEDPPVAVRDALRNLVETLCPDHFEVVYPYLGRVMSLPLEAEDKAKLQDLEGERLKTGTFRAVEKLVERAAQERPLVLVCEDLHWVDPTSIDLLEELLALTDRAPLLFICVFRPEREQGCWRFREAAARRYGYRHIDLWLDPLTPAESETLVDNLLHVEELSQGLKERVLSRAEGNPFCLEEVLRSLIDSGAIERDEATGRWQATRGVAEITIPETLHGVLMARIDRLQEETKRVLQLAAVIGRIFLYRVLAAIAEEERELEGHLLRLQREEMIRERARVPELEYIFKHQLTREAAYNGLLKRERRVFHRHVAEALEGLFSGRLDEQLGLLAYHWERAEEPEKAVEYLLRAGDQARFAYAHQEAIDYYQRALAYLKEGEEYERAAGTLMKLGLTYHNAFEFRRARQAYEEGFTLRQRAAETREEEPLPPPPHALRFAVAPPETLDPAMNYAANYALPALFSGLVEWSLEGSVVPEVARSWEVLDAGRKYVFHLRDDWRWSDGVPVTANDFEYAWKRALNPATEARLVELLYDIKGAAPFHQGRATDPDQVGVRALDDFTLIVELEAPTGYFLNLMAGNKASPVPRHVVEAHGAAWTEMENLVTNGAFVLDAWEPGRSIRFSRNPAYPGRFRGNLQGVEINLSIEGWADRLKAYEGDGVDIFGVFLPMPPAERERVRQRHAEEFVSAPSFTTAYVAFDTSRPPFDDVRVRRAFVLTTDRETLADVVLKGDGSPATGGFVPPGMPGHSAGIGLPYDPERGRDLLARAGYPPDGAGRRGFPVVEALCIGVHRTAFEHLLMQWRENLGVEIAWEIAEDWTTWSDRMEQDPPHIFSSGWAADYLDPDDFLRVGMDVIRLSTSWQNDAYDRLVEGARRCVDQGQRMALYAQADRILMEEAAVMPLFYSRSNVLAKPWAKLPPSPFGYYGQWKDIIIEPH